MQRNMTHCTLTFQLLSRSSHMTIEKPSLIPIAIKIVIQLKIRLSGCILSALWHTSNKANLELCLLPLNSFFFFSFTGPAFTTWAVLGRLFSHASESRTTVLRQGLFCGKTHRTQYHCHSQTPLCAPSQESSCFLGCVSRRAFCP